MPAWNPDDVVTAAIQHSKLTMKFKAPAETPGLLFSPLRS